MGTVDRRTTARSRIVEAAARLLQEHGPEAVTTRRVAEAAGVQAPAIYRLFGHKDGLLDAVAEHVMTTYATAKAARVAAASAEDVDPLEDLSSGWRSQIDFGLANPALFRLLSDPARVATSPGARMGRAVLEDRVRRLAAAGRLRVGEQRAVAIIQAAGTGVIQTLLATPVDLRDPELPEAMWDAVLTQILTDAHKPAATAPVTAAITLRAHADELVALRPAERQLLADWLARIIEAGADEATARHGGEGPPQAGPADHN